MKERDLKYFFARSQHCPNPIGACSACRDLLRDSFHNVFGGASHEISLSRESRCSLVVLSAATTSLSSATGHNCESNLVVISHNKTTTRPHFSESILSAESAK